MDYIPSGTLYQTIYYKANSGKPFKYEIFQFNDGKTVTATVSTLDEIAKGADVWTWVVVDQEITLLSDGEHPDHAKNEAIKHFRENYIVE